jgi:hypothetical protein
LLTARNMPPKADRSARVKSAKANKQVNDTAVDHSEVESMEVADLDIQRELKDNQIGHFKVYASSMTFKWDESTGRQNRPVNLEATSAKPLIESMKKGILRYPLINRMSGVVSREDLNKRIYSSDGHILALDKIVDSNEQMEFPTLVFNAKDNSNAMVEMQSGQHRMEILKTLEKRKSEHWWIVTLYDKGNHLLCI